jgi:hypothetical protein
VSFEVAHRKSYGYADSLDEAEAAFRAEYERWEKEKLMATDPHKVPRDAVIEAQTHPGAAPRASRPAMGTTA